MKNFILAALGALVFGSAYAQAPQGYHKFTDTKTVSGAAANEQVRANTSWSSALALFENELQRQGKGNWSLSAPWIARHVYFEKVLKYIRMRGMMDIAAGGSWEDVPNVIRKYGIVPAETYAGIKGLEGIDYQILNNTVKSMADMVINGSVPLNVWMTQVNVMLDGYFGAMPETFNYAGKRYTPASFRDMLGLNMDDYVCVTSFTHHPFYTWFAIEVADNWAWGQAYNLPQNEMLNVAVGALERGYAVWWGADMGTEYDKAQSARATANGAEMAQWVGVTPEQQMAKIALLLQGPTNGKEYSQTERQIAFDNHETFRDHGMLIAGIATDQDGGHYFKAKDSWSGSDKDFGGYFYASYAFFKYKTMEIAMHKDALPRELKVRLGYMAR